MRKCSNTGRDVGEVRKEKWIDGATDSSSAPSYSRMTVNTGHIPARNILAAASSSSWLF
jgi:hypothetical protein